MMPEVSIISVLHGILSLHLFLNFRKMRVEKGGESMKEQRFIITESMMDFPIRLQ